MKLFYQQFGDTGKPLIILHGLFGNSDNWASIGKQFGREYQVYLVDQRNHGRSPHDEEWTYEIMAHDLNEFIDEHQLVKPAILGHSMGGKTVMKYASLFEDKIDKLIVVDISPRQYPVHHQSIIDGLKAVPISEVASRREADTILQEHEPILGVRQFLLKNMYRKEDGKYCWYMNLDVIDRKIANVGESLELDTKIQVDTLFIGGGNSKYIQEKDRTVIDDLFANYTIKMIENTGHWVHAEKPKEFMGMIHEFINPK
ncbi:MAG: alpha/beta fold hydrolase [Cyclobacteriaceae bacterium]